MAAKKMPPIADTPAPAAPVAPAAPAVEKAPPPAEEATEIKAAPAPAPEPTPLPVPEDTAEIAPVKLEEHDPKELLENIQAPLVVELGRVNLSVLSVGELKPGRIIELARAPGEAVDLVVAGKSIGKGELVEIEGELGIRILSLVQ